MITDLGEIRRRADGMDAENLRFRRFLRNHNQPGEPFRILANRVQNQIDCKQCANCCRQTIVAPGDEDITKIAEYLRMEPRDVVRFYTTTEDPDAPGIGVLRNRKGGCIFLDGNLCMIYEARPRACRGFPHLVSSGRSLGSRMASICRRASYCPIVYNTLESYKKLIGYHPRP